MRRINELIESLPEKERGEWQRSLALELSIAKEEVSMGDYNWVDPDDHLLGIDLGNGLRDLPKDEKGNYLHRFKTDKHEYRIKTLEEISGWAWHTFKKVSAAAGTGKSFGEILAFVDKVMQMVLSAGIGESNLMDVLPKLSQKVVIEGQAFKDNIREFSQERWDAIYLSVTCMLVRDDEDAKNWSEEKAKDMIEDMLNYGYVNGVFFFVLGSRLKSFSKRWNDSVAKNPIQVEKTGFMESGFTMEQKKTDGKS